MLIFDPCAHTHHFGEQWKFTEIMSMTNISVSGLQHQHYFFSFFFLILNFIRRHWRCGRILFSTSFSVLFFFFSFFWSLSSVMRWMRNSSKPYIRRENGLEWSVRKRFKAKMISIVYRLECVRYAYIYYFFFFFNYVDHFECTSAQRNYSISIRSIPIMCQHMQTITHAEQLFCILFGELTFSISLAQKHMLKHIPLKRKNRNEKKKSETTKRQWLDQRYIYFKASRMMSPWLISCSKFIQQNTCELTSTPYTYTHTNGK